jgi:hypothetical protein
MTWKYDARNAEILFTAAYIIPTKKIIRIARKDAVK